MAGSIQRHLEGALPNFGGGSPNSLGAVAALNRRPSGHLKPNLVRRATSPLTAGGVRQSMITLVQTSLGGGVLTLAYALRLSGIGLGLFMLVALSFVAFLGMDIMMRGAVKLEAYDTATLLAKCVGKWSGPTMDAFLVLYGFGAMIAYFILLGDFLPSIAYDYGFVQSLPLTAVGQAELRTKCILATLLVVVPLSIPRKLSALRYATPVALLAITFTAVTVLAKAPSLYHAHIGLVGFGDAAVVNLDWGFFKAFGILLFAYNCHLNVVPVAAEMQSPTDHRITKVNMRAVLVEMIFYALIAAGGYLSFLSATEPNILKNYDSSICISICRTLLSCTILVGIPTYIVPTVRSLQGIVEQCLPVLAFKPDEQKQPLLAVDGAPLLESQFSESSFEASFGSECMRYALTAITLLVNVSVAIIVPNVADVMGFLGASVGTILMMVLPTIVLLIARPDGFSQTRIVLSAAYLIGASLISCACIVVMVMQSLGSLPA